MSQNDASEKISSEHDKHSLASPLTRRAAKLRRKTEASEAKEQHELTLVEIINNKNSGAPAKSELLQRAAIKHKKADGRSDLSASLKGETFNEEVKVGNHRQGGR